MKITLLNGSPAILSDSGAPVMQNITCGIRYTSADGTPNEVYTKGKWTLTEMNGETTASSDNAILTFRSEGAGITATCEYTYRGEAIKRTDDFIMLKGTMSEHIKTLLGGGVRENNGNRTNEMLTPVDTVDMASRHEFECGDFAALKTVGGVNYISGFLTSNEFFSGVHMTEDGTMEARHYTEQMPIKDGKMLKSDVFYITTCDDIVTAIPEYCDLVVKYTAGEPRLRFETPSGYCTWYYYLNDINEKIIENSIEDVSANREKLPVKYIQIDDGWQVCYGQWETNERFTGGMKACADKIKEAGFVPGLWFAPFWANIAKVRQEHPEYFAISRETGERTICFDYSVPEACEFMRDVFRRATHEWGFKYLKLDLITSCLGAYDYSDPEFNSLKNYKKCLQIINECVPEDTFLLGCTAPFAPSVGLVDGMRVSCDIFEHWDSVKEVFNCVLKRYYYHKRFFINDSDCLIIRKPENEDDECRRNCVRNDDQIRSYISATAASGGVLMFSDKLRLLDESQIDMLSYLFPQNTDAALPLDLMESYIPGVLDCGKREKIRTVMLINWDDEPKTMGIDTGDAHVFEFWTRTYKGKFADRYETKLAPHCCEVLFITSADTPTVIGTDSVIIPAINQSFADGILRADFAKKDETLYVAADTLNGDGCIFTKISDGLYGVKQTGDDMNIELTVR